MGFKGYLAKRILFIFPALIAVIVLDFAIMHAAPGDPVTMMVASIPVLLSGVGRINIIPVFIVFPA